MLKSEKKRFYLILVIIMMAFIFIHSAMPADLSQQESSGLADFIAHLFSIDLDLATTIVRKCAHFTEYLIFGVVLMLYMSAGRAEKLEKEGQMSAPVLSGKPLDKKSIYARPALYAWIAGALYAVTDEIHQMFVEGRSCEFRDMCIDAAGVAVGVVIVMAVILRKKRNP